MSVLNLIILALSAMATSTNAIELEPRQTTKFKALFYGKEFLQHDDAPCKYQRLNEGTNSEVVVPKWFEMRPIATEFWNHKGYACYTEFFVSKDCTCTANWFTYHKYEDSG